jgi:hypothetical protein
MMIWKLGVVNLKLSFVSIIRLQEKKLNKKNGF